jgi:hypothetical protein
MKFRHRPYFHSKLSGAYLLMPVFILISMLLMPFSVNALSLTSERDCNPNAVIRCGAISTNELISKYNNQPSVQAIYSNFSISRDDINAMGTTAVTGTVTSDGKVIVSGNVVANNAITAGRQNIAGSQAVTQNGVTFYKRPPSVSFKSSSLSSFVVMNSGRFDFAIIASCGNPVSATATAVKQPVQQKPAAVAPTPAPPAAVTPTPPPVVQQQQQQTVVESQSVPVATQVATPVPTPAPQPTQIPNTGIGDVVGFGSFVTLLSGTAHFLIKRKFAI